MTVTGALVDELLGTTPADVPQAAKERMRRAILDAVGTTYGGFPIIGAELAAYARDMGGKHEAVVIGGSMRASCELAAGINAQLARTMDFEEGGPGLHIAPSLIHTVLAVGQRVGASGADMLATACIVYEINARFHYANKNRDITRHINICLAMATAKLLGLDAEATNLAMGLCWHYPVRISLLLKPPRPKRISRLGMGNLWLCQDGIQAAILAQHGFGEMPDELDHRDEYDLDVMTSSPEPFFYTADELQLKPWPSSRQCLGGIQLSRELIAENAIAVDEIEGVTVFLPSFYLQPHLFDPTPETYWEAIYSVQWGTAMGILDIEPGPAWYTEEQLADPAARAMAARIEIKADEQATEIWEARQLAKVPNRVEIVARGETFTRSIILHDVLGGPGDPMPIEMLDDKFLRQAVPMVGETRARELLTTLWNFESVTDANELAELF